MTSPADVEVAIVGGGVAGATLALLLVQRARIDPARILLIEPEPVQAPAAGSAYDLRVVAISPGNRQLLTQAGAWQAMDQARVIAYERMAVWHQSIPPDSPDVLRFDAAELGEPDLGSIVENRNLQAALLARCAGEGIGLRKARLAGLECDAAQARITLDDGEVRAQLVVGADGAHSAVRRLAGIDVHARSYGQQGLVATVRTQVVGSSRSLVDGRVGLAAVGAAKKVIERHFGRGKVLRQGISAPVGADSRAHEPT